MKKVLAIIGVMVFLTSFLVMNSFVISADSDDAMQKNNVTSATQIKEKNQGDEIRIENEIRVKERLQAFRETGECPDNCTCSGSVTKCPLENGREMTVRAGNSGNIIVQVKGENMSTNVSLYQHEGRVFGVFRNNETKEIKVLPDEVRERLREKIRARLEIRNMTLDENGTYQVEVQKRARLFLIIPVREKVKTQVDSETGEVIRTRTSWWGFLAKDNKDTEEE